MRILFEPNPGEGVNATEAPAATPALPPSPDSSPAQSELSAPKPSTPTADDEAPTGSVPAKNSMLERLRAAGKRVLQFRGITFGRGKDESEPDAPDLAAPNVPRGVTTNPVGSGTAPDPAAASIFRRCCISSVKGVIDILNQVTRIFAGAADFDPKFTERAIATAEPDKEALSEFTESLDLVLKKHNVQPKHAEEFALAMSSVRLVSGYATMFALFKGEINRRRRDVLKISQGGKL